MKYLISFERCLLAILLVSSVNTIIIAQDIDVAGKVYIGDFANEGANPRLKVKMDEEGSGIGITNRNGNAESWIPNQDGSIILSTDQTFGEDGDVVFRKFESDLYKTLMTLEGDTKSLRVNSLASELFSFNINPLRHLYIDPNGKWKAHNSAFIISLPPSAFQDPYHINGAGGYSLKNSYVAVEAPSRTNVLYAQVNLPNRSKISMFTVTLTDALNSGDIQCKLYRKRNLIGTIDEIASISTVGTPGRITSNDFPTDHELVDNLNYQYYIELKPTTVWADGASGLQLGLHSARIDYYLEE